MSQWRSVLKMMQNATGGWVSTHDIRNELHVVNVGERIAEIERQGYRVEREVAWINGKRAARYRLRASGPAAQDGTKGTGGSEADSSPEPSPLFEPPAPHNENDIWRAA